MCKLLVAYNITGFGFNSSPFNVPVFRTHRVSQCEKNIQLLIIFADIVQYLKLISFNVLLLASVIGQFYNITPIPSK